MGTATEWQKDVIEKIQRETSLGGIYSDVHIFNPRRPDWDSTWEQKFTNPPFYQQVNWELANLQWATDVIFYLEPNTKSPITLMELGDVSKSKKIRVVCPDGFWRKGNVDIYCDRYHIPQFSTLDEAVDDFVNSVKLLIL